MNYVRLFPPCSPTPPPAPPRRTFSGKEQSHLQGNQLGELQSRDRVILRPWTHEIGDTLSSMPVALHFPGVGPGSCPYHLCASDGSLEASGVSCTALHAFLPKGRLLGPGQAECTADCPTSLTQPLGAPGSWQEPPSTIPSPLPPPKLSTDFSVMSHFYTFGPSCLCEVAYRDTVPILQISKLEAPGNELVASPGLF